jgi:hypothetical protein
LGLRREGNHIVARFHNSYARAPVERRVQQVVIEQTTLPADEPYRALLDRSRNLGEVDVEALLEGRAQAGEANPTGGFLLFRTGDAVAARDIHAALLDANRLCRTF